MTLPAPISKPWSSNSYQVYSVEGADNVIQSAEMENRIKEQLSLFADPLSSETMRANQIFSSLAYVLMQVLRRLTLVGTEWATA